MQPRVVGITTPVQAFRLTFLDGADDLTDIQPLDHFMDYTGQVFLGYEVIEIHWQLALPGIVVTENGAFPQPKQATIYFAIVTIRSCFGWVLVIRRTDS